MNHDNGRVVVDDPESMNLLGLLMDGLIRENMKSTLRRRLTRGLRGELRVQAGKMVATLRLDGGQVTIFAGARPGARAWIKGSMAGMLDLLTLNHLVRPLASRRVTFGGNPLFIVMVLPLMIPEVALKERLGFFVHRPSRVRRMRREA